MTNKQKSYPTNRVALLRKERGDLLKLVIDNVNWTLQFVPVGSECLQRSDGSYTIGVTDNDTKTISIANNLSTKMTDKVLCHELTHVFSFNNDCQFDIETEEIIADFMSLFGRDIIYLADHIMSKLLTRVA